MFDEVDKRLEAWAKTFFADLEVSFRAPGAETDRLSVCLYLLDVVPVPAGRGLRLPPLQMTLRYLVVPQGAVPSETHQLLGRLLISAMENVEFEIEKEQLPFEIWRAFGIMPQPSFVLLVPFKYERTEKLAPPVRSPLRVEQTVLETLQGRITVELKVQETLDGEISVKQIPVLDANVEIPLLKLSTKTDADGYFRFASIPSEPPDKNLLIRVKGREFSVSTSQAERRGNLFLFDLKLEE
jgi:hypothetical protein